MDHRSFYNATSSKSAFSSKHIILLASSLFGLMLMMFSCSKDTCKRSYTYTEYYPVYRSLDEVRQGLKVLPPQAVVQAGKTLIYKDYILLNDVQKGIHIFDNTDSANPKAVAFYAIDGNVDMEIKNDKLYIDQYKDLVVLDLSAPENLAVVQRAENVIEGHGFTQQDSVVTGWEAKEVSVEDDCSSVYYTGFIYCGVGDPSQLFFSTNSPEEYLNIGTKFEIKGDYLYLLDNPSLKTFNIDGVINLESSTDLDGYFEHISAWNEYVFLDRWQNMKVYNVTDPKNPFYDLSIDEIANCGNELFEGNFAYKSENPSNNCFGTDYAVHIYDISQFPYVSKKQEIKALNPHGIACKGAHLYVCDKGLKIYDISNMDAIQLIGTYQSEEVEKVILHSEQPIAYLQHIGGIITLDVSDFSNIQELNRIDY